MALSRNIGTRYMLESVDPYIKQPEILIEESERPPVRYMDDQANYITGSFYDQKGNPVMAVIMDIVNEAGESVLPNGPIYSETGTYDAWSGEPERLTLVFRAKGYAKTSVPYTTLMQYPDVIMKKEFPYWVLLLVAAAAYIYMRKTKKVGFLKTGDVFPIMLLVGGIVAFSVIKDVLEFLGLWDTKDTKDLDNAETDPGSFWNPNYWKDVLPPGKDYTFSFTQQQAIDICDEIWDAIGPFNDCESCIVSEFKKCRTKANASYIAAVFKARYGQDLLSWLRGGIWPSDRLSDADVNTITSYINNLPKY